MLNEKIYLMELLARNELSRTELGYITKIIHSFNTDYKPLIESYLVLPGEKDSRNSIYTVRLSRIIAKDDVDEINDSITSLNLNAKIRDVYVVLMIEMGEYEDKLETINRIVESELKFKHGLKMSGVLSSFEKELLENILWKYGGVKLLRLKREDYGYKIYLNNKISRSVLDDLNDELSVLRNFEKILYKH